MFYFFILTQSTISWSNTKSQQEHRWIIIGVLISSIICCYIYLQCLLPWLIKKLFRRTTNNDSSLRNNKSKKNKQHRLRVKTRIDNDDKRNNMNKKKNMILETEIEQK